MGNGSSYSPNCAWRSYFFFRSVFQDLPVSPTCLLSVHQSFLFYQRGTVLLFPDSGLTRHCRHQCLHPCSLARFVCPPFFRQRSAAPTSGGGLSVRGHQHLFKTKSRASTQKLTIVKDVRTHREAFAGAELISSPSRLDQVDFHHWANIQGARSTIRPRPLLQDQLRWRSVEDLCPTLRRNERTPQCRPRQCQGAVVGAIRAVRTWPRGSWS